MYVLKQAAILAYKELKEHLSLHGYAPIPNSNGLWKHKTCPTMFALCVNDFGVNYYNKEDANHLIGHYNKGYVDVSMPGYVLKALEKFQHEKPKFPQFAPHKWNQPAYGQKVQYATAPNASDHLNLKGQCLIQSIVGAFLYYIRAIDPTILVALNELGTQQSAPTVKMKKGAE
eukprot:2304081-Ditylum_brightwellii.AAC.1